MYISLNCAMSGSCHSFCSPQLTATLTECCTVASSVPPVLLLAEWVWPHDVRPSSSSWPAVREQRWQSSLACYCSHSTAFGVSDGGWHTCTSPYTVEYHFGIRLPLPLTFLTNRDIWYTYVLCSQTPVVTAVQQWILAGLSPSRNSTGSSQCWLR